MAKKRRFDFTKKNKRSGKVENVGYLDLEQDEEQSRCSLYFYTDAESLKEDAEAKLDELSKPYRSYTAEIINLVEAVQDEEKKEQYKEVFSIALGDTVLLISKSTGIRESHRIVKFYEYPLTKEKNKVELANTRLSFEEVQRTEQELS